MAITHVAMEGWGFKEESKQEKDSWASPVVRETFEAQEVLVLPEHLMARWETICHQEPEIKHWERFFLPLEEAA